jgi:hypothetical protein
VIGIVSLLWESNYAGLAERGISLVHQLAVAGPFRRQGVAMMLLGAAEDLARRRGAAELAMTVELFDEYGPAQRLYARRGYLPDGRSACRGQHPLSRGLSGHYGPRLDLLAHQRPSPAAPLTVLAISGMTGYREGR